MDPAELDTRVDAARGGDHKAFAHLMEAVVDDLRIFIAVRCTSRELVDEVLQASLVACFESLPNYRSVGTFLAWLKGIARHTLARALREQSRFHAIDGDALEAALQDASLRRLEGEAMDDDCRQLHVAECLRRLTPRAREMLERHHIHGLPLTQLARQFKQTTLAIASTLKRIRQALRDCVDARTHA